MRILSLFLGLAVAMCGLASQGKDIFVTVDFFDEMGLTDYSPAMTSDHIRKLVKRHKEAGVDGLLWRVASLGLAGYPSGRLTQISEICADRLLRTGGREQVRVRRPVPARIGDNRDSQGRV